jgi:ATP-dependent protease ClpP protease subunit
MKNATAPGPPRARVLALEEEVQQLERAVQREEQNATGIQAAHAPAVLLESGWFQLFGDWNAQLMAEAYQRLYAWSINHKAEPLTVVLHAWGGDAHDALGLHDVLCDLASSGHHLIGRIEGHANLQAMVVLQACHERQADANALINLCPLAACSQPFTNLLRQRSAVNSYMRFYKHLLSVIAARSGKVTVPKLRSLISDLAWRPSLKKATQYGLIDPIG